MEEQVEVLKCLEEKICTGRDMVERLKLAGEVDGVEKLIRKIQQEIRFLEKVQSTGNVKKEHLQSTNLIHLNAMVARLFYAKDPTSIMKPFKYEKSRLEVDIICNGGASWVKVIARNAKALTLISMGNECPLATKLEQMGVIVEGDRINVNCEEKNTIEKFEDDERSGNVWSHTLRSEGESVDGSVEILNPDLNVLDVPLLRTEINILNLDVSTLLAYVTNMTNGYACFVYREPLLTQQAEMERRRPVKPILEKLFKGKQLIVCRTAHDNFMNIIDVIGGPNERIRAQDLLKRVQIVDDITTGRIMEGLSLGGKIKNRSRLVFATGENMRSITVSANEGFVRAARMQGIECAVFLHEPRSLSEIKEGYAKETNSS
ncbi:hypothetical protein KM043_011592 [Ampulex compressa]|nr:hypothetical protein KM043_011592 [Ampulex compressa]